MVRNKVYLLHHVHEYDDGHEDTKLIGVYSSKEKAKAALKKYTHIQGFSDYPKGFEISERTIDRDDWREGFITLTPEQFIADVSKIVGNNEEAKS